ncbi:hypothetical protein CERSUDRAFT_73769 [Gelatoporia subvermispora B]|uniref:Uncharacterized protein n=1 Tax=Ceriporiopsis subvermispora (strain B) TaxID=914234 RepID=M2RE29_CERS8|nr:hypothetical protein CERSUDRAFT_73769 [Gelatoporia subvermispora B]
MVASLSDGMKHHDGDLLDVRELQTLGLKLTDWRDHKPLCGIPVFPLPSGAVHLRDRMYAEFIKPYIPWTTKGLSFTGDRCSGLCEMRVDAQLLVFGLKSTAGVIPALKIGFIVTYIALLAFLLCVPVGKEAYDDYKRHQRDREANFARYLILEAPPVGESRETDAGLHTCSVRSSALRVGDLVLLEKNQRVPTERRTGSRESRCLCARNWQVSGSCWNLTRRSMVRLSGRAFAETVVRVTPVVNDDGSVTYQASSPDEVVIVKWTSSVGLTLTFRDRTRIKLQTPAGTTIAFEVLELFPFTSELKRMGIIVRDLQSREITFLQKEITFLQKGADVVMARLVQRNDWLEDVCANLAREGLRTLVVARRRLSEQANEAMAAVVAALLERDLELLGLTGVDDKLQDEVKSTIELLRNVGIKIWILTGDRIETVTCMAISTKSYWLRGIRTNDFDVPRVCKGGQEPDLPEAQGGENDGLVSAKPRMHGGDRVHETVPVREIAAGGGLSLDRGEPSPLATIEMSEDVFKGRNPEGEVLVHAVPDGEYLALRIFSEEYPIRTCASSRGAKKAFAERMEVIVPGSTVSSPSSILDITLEKKDWRYSQTKIQDMGLERTSILVPT